MKLVLRSCNSVIAVRNICNNSNTLLVKAQTLNTDADLCAGVFIRTTRTKQTLYSMCVVCVVRAGKRVSEPTLWTTHWIHSGWYLRH